MISQAAKDLIEKMLNYDYKKRISSKEALQHHWVTKNSRTAPLNKIILQNLAQFQAKTKLNTAFLTFIATAILTQNEKTEAMKAFQSMDKNGDGLLSKQELIEGFIKLYRNKNLAEQAVENIMKQFGLANDENIDYTQFVIATLNKDQILNTKKNRASLQHFRYGWKWSNIKRRT
eukprot:TRINITY_DN4518_c1_g2_i1.p3 TRINITY_DN4518_c1_g2~~TRINITY_DN4518_c1_g2_i1.p3  ORF type:complete len:175 (+),score=15.75 TRINITY_DN4518_c1_g2_i1:312-836(+)